jgi:alkylhydroperoxidase/carboxymuconolactone decarboxylase family protein YurZ
VGRDARRSEELLHELADGNLSGIEASGSGGTGPERLDPETLQVAQVAALAAVDASPVSWFAHLGAAETDAALDRIVGALIAVAPIVGTPKVVSAAAKIISATGLVEEVDEDVP